MKNVIDNIIILSILLCSFSKMLYLVRFDQRFCMLVKAFTKVLKELYAFIISYITLIVLFSVIVIIMQG